MKVLLTSADPSVKEMVALAVASIERNLGEPLKFLSTSNGEQGVRAAWRERPAVIVADEIASRAGAFHLAKELRGAMEPFEGVIVILLDRPHDTWLARWSGADLWFVKPVDPFALAEGILEALDRSDAADALAGTSTDAPAVPAR